MCAGCGAIKSRQVRHGERILSGAGCAADKRQRGLAIRLDHQRIPFPLFRGSGPVYGRRVRNQGLQHRGVHHAGGRCDHRRRVTPHATGETSLDLQRRFAEAVPAVVVGRDIDTVNLDRVAGNSHTTAGFNNALEKIKAEASQ